MTDTITPMVTPRRPLLRRILTWLKWTVIIALAALALAVLGGAIWYRVASAGDPDRFAPPGRMVSVGTHRMYIHCEGEGTPTVVLEAGLQFWSTTWWWVQRRVREETRVCSYDRSGLGWSELGPGPYEARSMVAELHTLLEASGEHGPYVLVGHSLGGMLVRVFYEAYPDDVVGMVLADPGVPTEYYDEGEDVDAPCGWRCPAARMLASVGAFRFMYRGIMTNPEYPAEAVPEIRALLGTPRAAYAVARSLTRLGKTALETMENEYLDSIPVVVLHSTDWGLDTTVDSVRERRAARRDRMLRGMEDIVALSALGRGPIPVEGSNHESIVMYDRFAQQVTDEIGRVVMDLRGQRPTAHPSPRPPDPGVPGSRADLANRSLHRRVNWFLEVGAPPAQRFRQSTCRFGVTKAVDPGPVVTAGRPTITRSCLDIPVRQAVEDRIP